MDPMHVPRSVPMTLLIPSEYFMAATMFSPNMEIDTPLFEVDADADPRFNEIDDTNINASLDDAVVTDSRISDPPHEVEVPPVPETALPRKRFDQHIPLADS